jgi:hypothetical protein
LNFVATVRTSRTVRPQPNGTTVLNYNFVNLPLRLDVATQFANPIVVRDRNGSKRIRTFAADDTIYSGNNGGAANVDGGLGVNTVVYSGPSTNYTVALNSAGAWTVKDNVGTDGTDTLVRIQRLQFTDKVVSLN